MMLGRIKVLFSAIALIVLMYSSHTLADEKYTANECFENFSRGTLKFNQGLDKAIFKPVAKGYRALPSPVRKGTGFWQSHAVYIWFWSINGFVIVYYILMFFDKVI